MMKTLLAVLALSLHLAVVPAAAQTISSREPQLTVFPQPASSQLTISFDTEDINSAQVLIFDLLGNKVSEIDADRFDNGTFTIYIGDKKPGYYFLKIVSGDKTFSRRITIKP